MPRTLRFSSLFMVLIALGVLAGAVDMLGRETRARVKFRQTPTDQPRTLREWRPIDFRKDLVLGTHEAEGFGSPCIVRVDAQGNIYVLDFDDGSIKKFDRTGRFLLRFSNETNIRPTGFLSLSDFAVDPAGKLWTIDKGARTLTLFDRTGVVRREVQLDARPQRLIHDAERLVVALLSPTAHLFEAYSHEGRRVRQFGSIIDEQEKNFPGLEGWMATLEDGTFVYAPLYAGLFARFSATGELLYLRRTIKPVSATVLDVDRKGIRRVAREAGNSAFGIGAWEGKIYIVTNEDGSWQARESIDFYRDSDGEYLYSVRLPEPSVFAFLYGPHLFTVGQKTVTRWAVTSSQPSQPTSVQARR